MPESPVIAGFMLYRSLFSLGNYFKEIAPGVSMHFSSGGKLIERMKKIIENEMKSYKDYPTGFYFNQIRKRAEFKAGLNWPIFLDSSVHISYNKQRIPI